MLPLLPPQGCVCVCVFFIAACKILLRDYSWSGLDLRLDAQEVQGADLRIAGCKSAWVRTPLQEVNFLDSLQGCVLKLAAG